MARAAITRRTFLSLAVAALAPAAAFAQKDIFTGAARVAAIGDLADRGPDTEVREEGIQAILRRDNPPNKEALRAKLEKEISLG